jgi:HD-GYP domain-containing protein (c-di-GMP phosphodiesterase class II)
MDNAQGLIPIQSLDIEAESSITFDLYVNLPLNNKYILYRRKGGRMESERLGKLVNGNLKNFFIRQDDYPEFVKYIAHRMRDLMIDGNSTTDIDEQRRLMVQSARSLLSSTFQQDDSAVLQAMVGNLRDITGAVIDSVIAEKHLGPKRLFERLSELAEKGSTFQRHPVNVASFTVLITMCLGYDSPKTLIEAAKAALLHDVGLAKLPTRIISQAHAPLNLSIDDRLELFKHPQMTLDLLKEKSITVTPMMEMMIMQHHEQFNGSGYPKALRGFLMSEMAQVLHFCDLLDEVIVQNSHTKIGMKVRVIGLLDRLASERTLDPILIGRIRSAII